MQDTMYYTAPEVAKIMGVTQVAVRDLIRHGSIHGAIKNEGVWLIPDSEVYRHIIRRLSNKKTAKKSVMIEA